MLCLNGFELYSRWVPLISVPLVFHLSTTEREYFGFIVTGYV